jgi:hypothetical protein
MCGYAEQLILLDALNGDQEAVTSKVAEMLPAERQAFREALAAVEVALGFDCAACSAIVPVREAVSTGPLGGPFSYYHQGHQPRRAAAQGDASA